ncbi:uncharacterized protein LOC122502979 [Leptopilina heterotoma]|uniref:uncharacterized protein LOC122502979 n=1 Tax=Leptopilina heterotoma TaxID=63436 RepID=UPI001CA88840|nr:uncharacterized protein LOC122502979 [Leptopilina heterotoma]
MAQLKTILLFSIFYICLLMALYCYADGTCIDAGLRCMYNPKKCCPGLECLPDFVDEKVCSRREPPYRCVVRGGRCDNGDRDLRCCGASICIGTSSGKICRNMWD